MRVDGWFSEHGGIPLAVHGTLKAAVPLQALAERVAEIVGRVPIAFAGGPERVRTLAICSGRPGGIALEAGALGVDALLTGEPQEDFRALARELGISIVCAGHHATETLGVRAAGDLLSGRFASSTSSWTARTLSKASCSTRASPRSPPSALARIRARRYTFAMGGSIYRW